VATGVALVTAFIPGLQEVSVAAGLVALGASAVELGAGKAAHDDYYGDNGIVGTGVGYLALPLALIPGWGVAYAAVSRAALTVTPQVTEKKGRCG
jgi:hypothetical protein